MDDLLSKVTTWRRELHQIPELALQEKKTSQYLQQALIQMGYQVKTVIGTGVLAYLDAKKETTIALRADMDGLEVMEKTNCNFHSKHKGMMHACGHDGHMAALLGAAYCLRSLQDQVKYNILFVFQPSEETIGGALLLMKEKIFETYRVKAVFGMHLMPSIEEGAIACKSGPLMAECGELDVTIHGKAAHAGQRELGIDSILIASKLITSYYQILPKVLLKDEKAVIHIGKIEGGTVRNMVAETSHFHGTVRVYREKLFDDIVREMELLNQQMEQKYHCQIDFSLPPMYPPVINDDNLYQQFKTCIKDKYIELKEPLMLSEDFAFYQKVVPGIFFYVGTQNKTMNSGLHTPTFQFQEKVLLKAIDLYVQIATSLQMEGFK